jgi:hypothetical protein
MTLLWIASSSKTDSKKVPLVANPKKSKVASQVSITGKYDWWQFHQHFMNTFCAEKSTNIKCKYKKAEWETFFSKNRN